jgi:hypothetical protein
MPFNFFIRAFSLMYELNYIGIDILCNKVMYILTVK